MRAPMFRSVTHAVIRVKGFLKCFNLYPTFVPSILLLLFVTRSVLGSKVRGTVVFRDLKVSGLFIIMALN